MFTTKPASRRLYTDLGQDFSTRHAAVRSIKAFNEILRPDARLPNTNNAVLPVYLALYDTLNDDDEEIRDIGADIVSWTLSTTSTRFPSGSLIPPAARYRFSTFLAQNYSESANLFIEALFRLTVQTKEDNCPENTKSATAVLFTPVHDRLVSARTEDFSLFIEEKQNLFNDEVREAETWSRVLKQLAKSAYDEKAAAEFSDWVVEGINALTNIAKSEVDGMLGWTSKPEVFTLGMQVILGAGVVQHWSKTGVVGAADACVSGRLKKLRDAGRKSFLHERWIDSIELVLEGSS